MKDLKWFETPIDIRYADTDQMGVVHHSVYACYLEIGRTKLMEMLGTPYTLFEAEHFYMMVARMDSRFKAPLRYGETISVYTALTKLNPRMVVFDYRIIGDHERDIRFTGSTVHVVTNQHGRPTRLTDRFIAVLKRACYSAA